jgi:hypothetical protein
MAENDESALLSYEETHVFFMDMMKVIATLRDKLTRHLLKTNVRTSRVHVTMPIIELHGKVMETSFLCVQCDDADGSELYCTAEDVITSINSAAHDLFPGQTYLIILVLKEAQAGMQESPGRLHYKLLLRELAAFPINVDDLPLAFGVLECQEQQGPCHFKVGDAAAWMESAWCCCHCDLRKLSTMLLHGGRLYLQDWCTVLEYHGYVCSYYLSTAAEQPRLDASDNHYQLLSYPGNSMIDLDRVLSSLMLELSSRLPAWSPEREDSDGSDGCLTNAWIRFLLVLTMNKKLSKDGRAIVSADRPMETWVRLLTCLSLSCRTAVLNNVKLMSMMLVPLGQDASAIQRIFTFEGSPIGPLSPEAVEYTSRRASMDVFTKELLYMVSYVNDGVSGSTVSLNHLLTVRKIHHNPAKEYAALQVTHVQEENVNVFLQVVHGSFLQPEQVWPAAKAFADHIASPVYLGSILRGKTPLVYRSDIPRKQTRVLPFSSALVIINTGDAPMPIQKTHMFSTHAKCIVLRLTHEHYWNFGDFIYWLCQLGISLGCLSEWIPLISRMEPKSCPFASVFGTNKSAFSRFFSSYGFGEQHIAHILESVEAWPYSMTRLNCGGPQDLLTLTLCPPPPPPASLTPMEILKSKVAFLSPSEKVRFCTSSLQDMNKRRTEGMPVPETDPKIRVLCYRTIIQTHYESNQCNKALVACSEFLEFLEEQQQSTALFLEDDGDADIYLLIAALFIDNCRFEDAQTALGYASEAAKQSMASDGGALLRCKLSHFTAILCIKQGDYAAAQEYALVQCRLAAHLDCHKYLALGYVNMANILAHDSNYADPSALTLAYMGMVEAYWLPDTFLICMSHLAILYRMYKNPARSIMAYKCIMYDFSRMQMDDRTSLFGIYLNMALSYAKMRNKTEAVGALEHAQADMSSSPLARMSLVIHSAQVYRELNLSCKADHFAQQAKLCFLNAISSPCISRKDIWLHYGIPLYHMLLNDLATTSDGDDDDDAATAAQLLLQIHDEMLSFEWTTTRLENHVVFPLLNDLKYEAAKLKCTFIEYFVDEKRKTLHIWLVNAARVIHRVGPVIQDDVDARSASQFLEGVHMEDLEQYCVPMGWTTGAQIRHYFMGLEALGITEDALREKFPLLCEATIQAMSAFHRYSEEHGRMYDAFIRPVEPFLPKTPDALVVIIPPKQFSTVPFPLLWTRKPSVDSFPPQFLFQRHTLCVYPSIHLFAKQYISPSSTSFAVVRRPTYLGESGLRLDTSHSITYTPSRKHGPIVQFQRPLASPATASGISEKEQAEVTSLFLKNVLFQSLQEEKSAAHALRQAMLLSLNASSPHSPLLPWICWGNVMFPTLPEKPTPSSRPRRAAAQKNAKRARATW